MRHSGHCIRSNLSLPNFCILNRHFVINVGGYLIVAIQERFVEFVLEVSGSLYFDIRTFVRIIV
jgi:hypothetical protein